MDEPSGWLWVVIGVVGIGGLAVAMAYAIVMWSRRRKDFAARRKQDQVVQENYRKGG